MDTKHSLEEPAPVTVPMITSMTARFTIDELLLAHHQGIYLNFAYYPDGLNGKRKYWRGVPTIDQITLARTLVGAALGRNPSQERRPVSRVQVEGKDDRIPTGQIVFGFERIMTYKWTTPRDRKKPLPPGSYAWRDTHTGVIYLEHPIQAEEQEAV